MNSKAVDSPLKVNIFSHNPKENVGPNVAYKKPVFPLAAAFFNNRSVKKVDASVKKPDRDDSLRSSFSDDDFRPSSLVDRMALTEEEGRVARSISNVHRGVFSSVDFQTLSGKIEPAQTSLYHNLLYQLEQYEAVIQKDCSIPERLEALKVLQHTAESYARIKCDEINAPLESVFKRSSSTRSVLLTEPGHQEQFKKNREDIDAIAALLTGIDQEQEMLEQSQKTYIEESGRELLGEIRSSDNYSTKAVAKQQEARNLLLKALLEEEEAKIPSEKLPRLMSTEDARAFQAITPEKLKQTMGFSPAKMKGAEARLTQLKKHITTVTQITELNAVLNSNKHPDQSPLDIGTQEGFDAYIKSAPSYEEMNKIGNYRPASHLAGAAIVTDWNQY